MKILAIDPGCTQTAFVLYDSASRSIDSKGKIDNAAMLKQILVCTTLRPADVCVIEMVASYGMAVGKEVFETVYWIGRFAQQWLSCTGREASRLYRRDVKMFLCGNNRAKDSNIRQALIDMYGGKSAIGLKKTPGPLYGVSKDIWAALSVATTFASSPATPRLTAQVHPAPMETPERGLE